MTSAADLVTLATDGSHRAAPTEPGEDPRLATLLQLRTMLGAAPEARIGARMPLPVALGTNSADHVLPGTLTALAGSSGDLTREGWRLGPGADHAWRYAAELQERTLDAARIGLFEFEGPLSIAVLGPVSLAAGALLGNGQRLLADPGVLRELPLMLAEGVRERAARLQERVPGARVHVLVREDALDLVHRGRVRTPSGRGRYPARSAAAIGRDWGALLDGLAGAEQINALTLETEASVDLVRAAREAGARRLAITAEALPDLSTRPGREVFEQLAGAHDAGVALELILDPLADPQRALDRFLGAWSELGFAARDAVGLTLVARADARGALRRDPSAEPPRSALLTAPALDALLTLAPVWAERVAD